MVPPKLTVTVKQEHSPNGYQKQDKHNTPLDESKILTNPMMMIFTESADPDVSQSWCRALASHTQHA